MQCQKSFPFLFPLSCVPLLLTCEAGDDATRVTVALLANGVVVELLFTVVALAPVEVRLAVALAVVVARRSDRAGRVAVAR